MKYINVVAGVLLLAGFTHVTDAGRILAVFPFPARSHMNVLNALLNGLAEKGHDITVLTAIAQEKVPKNVKQIDLKMEHGQMGSKSKINIFSMGDMNIFYKIFMVFGAGGRICDMVLSNPVTQEFIKTSTDSFDVLITEAFFNDCVLGFAHQFQIPIIQVCPFGGTEWMDDFMGNPHPYAYIPNFLLDNGAHMTFLERLSNALTGVFVQFAWRFWLIPAQNDLMQKHFAGTGVGPVPHVLDLDRKTSLLLLNNHVSLHSPRPFVPNIVEVGGMHIKPTKKLPSDLQKFLDSATGGVIYFSMGSNLKSSSMPEEKRDALLQAFGSLKQQVLWKWEEDDIPGKPDNVRIEKWLPQNDLLAHPNVKLFITHGGLLSTQEAVYHGKPVVGIPIFGDQKMNMQEAERAGYGHLLPFSTITNTTVTQAIKTVLSDPRYGESSAKISRIFRDKPHTPLETAVYWSEYVMRHKGAHHLRSAALDLAWYQYYLLDVLAVLAGGVLVILVVCFLTVRAVVRCLCKKKTTDKKKRN